MDDYIKQLEVTELTALQVMQSNRNTYNPYEWKKAINLYLSIDNSARFFTTKVAA